MLEVPKKNLSLHLKIKIITIENILWHTKNYEVRFESLDFFVLASILARVLGRFQIAKLPRKLLKKEFMMIFIFSLFFFQFFLFLFASLRNSVLNSSKSESAPFFAEKRQKPPQFFFQKSAIILAQGATILEIPPKKWLP